MAPSVTTSTHTVRMATIAITLGMLSAAHATDTERESTNLVAIERQLDTIDRLAAQSEQIPNSGNTHEHFDYARLHADIARVRDGIQDYLSPRRSLPRDPSALVGHYRVRTDAP
ncbi:type III effector Hop protein [Burkholderia pseudomallei]|nr:type III effector Hop protein [Burkholderia pseudomallei]